MELDSATCERARLSRDARFDGRFFVGVLTTGIYCRPVCPVKAPRPENRVFFPSAAAAAEAGFRPCLRCRPEAAPGTPAWNGTNATVARAMRLIGSGALDGTSMEEFAERLGVGSRHLTRLFRRHLGATPAAIARTRRLHYAKKLLDETSLGMADLAHAAGYGSVRRFNDEFRGVYGSTPSEVRRRDRHARTSGGDYRIALDYRPPYDWKGVLRFLRERAIPGVEWADGEAYGRTFEIEGARGTFEVHSDAGANRLICTIRTEEIRCLVPLIDRVKRMFDLTADPGEITRELARDERLAPLVAAEPGMRIPGSWGGFETAVRAIVGQQVSVAAARTTSGRLAERYGERIAGGDRGSHLFPTPAQLAALPPEGAGMPKAKATALRELAKGICRDEIRLEEGMAPEELREQLCSVKGIGPWTADYVAMRFLGEPDAFPHPDLVLIQAAGILLGNEGANARAAGAMLLARAEAWRPWRAYAALHLWRAATAARAQI